MQTTTLLILLSSYTAWGSGSNFILLPGGDNLLYDSNQLWDTAAEGGFTEELVEDPTEGFSGKFSKRFAEDISNKALRIALPRYGKRAEELVPAKFNKRRIGLPAGEEPHDYLQYFRKRAVPVLFLGPTMAECEDDSSCAEPLRPTKRDLLNLSSPRFGKRAKNQLKREIEAFVRPRFGKRDLSVIKWPRFGKRELSVIKVPRFGKRSSAEEFHNFSLIGLEKRGNGILRRPNGVWGSILNKFSKKRDSLAGGYDLMQEAGDELSYEKDNSDEKVLTDQLD